MKNFLNKSWSAVRTGATRVGSYAKKHKIIAGIVIIIILVGGYSVASAIAKGKAAAEYVLAATTQGPLSVTVTDSGQVSAEHQLNLTPKGSGEVESVDVSAGDTVKAGQTIATLDMTDAAEAVQTARENLQSAQISYQQTETSSQNGISNDQISLNTANTNTSTSLTKTYTDLPSITTGLDTALNGFSTLPGYTSERNLDAYANYINTATSQQYHTQITTEDQTAIAAYQSAQSAYAAYDINAATPQQTQALAATTLSALQSINQVLRDTITYYNYVSSQSTVGGKTAPSSLTTQISSLTQYQSTVSSDMSSVQSANTTLTNAQQSLSSDTQTLNGSGATLTQQSAQLNLQKAQDSLAQALQAESDYIVTAPFDGTIASVAVKKYDQASSGTAVAVLITKENYVDLSMNEADVAKVSVGQPASITFDAIDGLTLDGTVAEVDQVGTVSQSVVTYDVKVGFDTQDDRVKPGMTADVVVTTASVANAIQVPSAAVHTTGNSSYVEVATLIGTSTAQTAAGAPGAGYGAGGMGSSTARFRTASSTGARNFGSTTPAGFGGGTGATSSTTRTFGTAFTRSLTVPESEVKMVRVPVTIGISSDTMVQITSGLSRGQLVVTNTTSSAKTTSTASSGGLFSLFGAKKTTTTGTGAGATAGFSRSGATGGAGTYRAAGGAGAPPFGG